jgi:hypothetical protein
MSEVCFVCGRLLRWRNVNVITEDGQTVSVGPDCYRTIGKDGLQTDGGPKIFVLGNGHQEESRK